MIKLEVYNETATLEAVVLGIHESLGGVPRLEDAYDPKSKEHIRSNTYPKEVDIKKELDAFEKVLLRYDVTVIRPEIQRDNNQVFVRDIGIVIEDRFIVPQILDKRLKEIDGINFLIDQIDQKKLLKTSGSVRIEGGDVILWNEQIFVGYSKEADFKKHIVSRTNEAGVEFLMDHFENWTIRAFELRKSDQNPFENALHLDCCFQPIGVNKAIIHKEGFKNKADADWLIGYFGVDNVIEISAEEMYHMNANVFSISPEVIVSERKFYRLNEKLRSIGFLVEEIPFAEIAKMEGLLRCSTLPLKRCYV